MPKPDYLSRMEEEYKELCERMGKLEQFIHTNPIFDTMDKREQVRMISQLAGMKSYSYALDSRIWAAHNPELDKQFQM